MLVNPTLLLKAKWHFGWKIDSEVMAENYIAHSWIARNHPEAEFFWGDWKALGYDQGQGPRAQGKGV